MNTFSLNCITSKLIPQNGRVRFLGVFAADKIPDCAATTHTAAACFVANTDPAHKAGQHWVAFYMPPSPARLEFFDSYGLTPAGYAFPHLPPEEHIFANRAVLQGLTSDVCGHYCMIYLLLRSRGATHFQVCSWLASIRPASRDHFIRSAAVTLASRVGNCAVDCDNCAPGNQCCVARAGTPK